MGKLHLQKAASFVQILLRNFLFRRNKQENHPDNHKLSPFPKGNSSLLIIYH